MKIGSPARQTCYLQNFNSRVVTMCALGKDVDFWYFGHGTLKYMKGRADAKRQLQSAVGLVWSRWSERQQIREVYVHVRSKSNTLKLNTRSNFVFNLISNHFAILFAVKVVFHALAATCLTCANFRWASPFVKTADTWHCCCRRRCVTARWAPRKRWSQHEGVMGVEEPSHVISHTNDLKVLRYLYLTTDAHNM